MKHFGNVECISKRSACLNRSLDSTHPYVPHVMCVSTYNVLVSSSQIHTTKVTSSKFNDEFFFCFLLAFEIWFQLMTTVRSLANFFRRTTFCYPSPLSVLFGERKTPGKWKKLWIRTVSQPASQSIVGITHILQLQLLFGAIRRHTQSHHAIYFF